MMRVALVDDVASEREIDAIVLRRHGLQVSELEPTAGDPGILVDDIVSRRCQIAAVDWQLSAVPGVTYDGEAVLRLLMDRAPNIKRILWTKARKITDEVSISTTRDDFLFVPKERGASGLAAAIENVFASGNLGVAGALTLIEVTAADRHSGRLVGRVLGFFEQPVELGIPDQGLPSDVFREGAVFRARVRQEGASIVIDRADTPEPDVDADALSQQLRRFIPDEPRIIGR